MTFIVIDDSVNIISIQGTLQSSLIRNLRILRKNILEMNDEDISSSSTSTARYGAI